MYIDIKELISPQKTDNYFSQISELAKEISCFRFDTGRNFDGITNRDFRSSIKSLLAFILYIRNQYLHERLRILDDFTNRLSKIYVEIIDLFQDVKITKPSVFLFSKNNNFLCLNSMNSRYVYKDTNSRTVQGEFVVKKNNTIPDIRHASSCIPSKTKQLAGIDFIHFEGGTVTYTPSGWKHTSEDFVRPFAISKYPITYRQFLEFLQKKPDYYQKSLSNPLFLRDFLGLDEYNRKKVLDAAVYYIGWYDAAEYCNYLSSLYQRPCAYSRDLTTLNNNGFRLPSEAEWVFALTGGDASSSVHKEDSIVCRENRIGFRGKVVPNAILSENDFGVCGMLGNINEWTNTDATVIRLKSFEKNRNNSKLRKIIKGGSFASSRRMITPNYATDVSIDNLHYIGFRIAFSIE